ncbi:carotenoid biosynthesis protein [Nonomuraea indica]|uniref:Carotenoid biosynthesis protein n=1 Tax=Nonomuraea indica TaxID=1581193 RepID=A0ABW8AFN6_9ACTN
MNDSRTTRTGAPAPARRPRLPVAGRKLGTVALAAMVILQVVSGLHADPGRFTTPIVAVLALSAVSFAAAARGWTRALTAFGAAVATGYAAEVIGVATGFPFGAYRYTGALWPEVGGVPVAVAVAWGGMGLAAYGIGCAVAAAWPVRLAAGALAMTAWDLFLDPQMIRLGLWTWAEPGPYRGVPLTNFAGWLLVSLLVMVVLWRVLGDVNVGRGLVGVYTTMAVMETVGFAAVFTPPDPLVAAVGGTAMGAFAVAAWARTWRVRRRGSRGWGT